MKPDYRSTQNGTATADKGPLSERIETAIFDQARVKAKCRIEGGNLRMAVTDLADWFIARKIAREQFGFHDQNVMRETD
jgi:hypothetical protein